MNKLAALVVVVSPFALLCLAVSFGHVAPWWGWLLAGIIAGELAERVLR